MKMDHETYEGFKQGVGLILASTRVVYESAVQVGFSEEQALMLATAYMTNSFQQAAQFAQGECEK